jgi:hypothetical protein
LGVTPPIPQPHLHELVSCVQAPTVALSGPDGQIRPGGAQGGFRQDRRVLSALVVDVDGHEPVAAGHRLASASEARFVGVVRHVGDPSADPTVWLERRRRVRPDGMDERLVLVNAARTPITVTVTVQVAVDLAGVTDVKHGAKVPPLAAQSPLVWADSQTEVTVAHAESGAWGTVLASSEPATAAGLVWQVTVPARSHWAVELVLAVTDREPVPNAFLPAVAAPGWDAVAVSGRTDLSTLVEQGVADVAALALADPLAPGLARPVEAGGWQARRGQRRRGRRNSSPCGVRRR